MNKGEFIDALAEKGDLSKADATRTIESVLDIITTELKDGGQVVFPGFGSFSTNLRAAREGRNPQTGEKIQIKATRVAKFKAGKALKDAVHQG